MRRWNGWGDDSVKYPLPESAIRYLDEALGIGFSSPDVGFESILATIPPSRLPPHPLILTAPESRLRHARGQSLPDWIALRAGEPGPVPDGVAFPESSEQVRTLINYAGENDVQVIPYGGGTSVVGHINPLPEFGPALTISMRKLNRQLDLDEESHLATFEAGASGPEIERLLSEQGYTLGHYPQSWEYSTLGGWIATRSSGQQSLYYGRIEDLFRGGSVETPEGTLALPPLPASAAGPDLRQLILGSEGRIGLITQATVRVRPLPEGDRFYGAFFPSWEAGFAAARALAQQRVDLSMVRLSDAQETATMLALSGQDRLLRLADLGLKALGQGPERCLMVYGLTGGQASIRFSRSRAHEIFRRQGGLPAGGIIGHTWEKSRFRAPYLRNTLWERGYALDTLETAVKWAGFERLRRAVLSALDQTFSVRCVRALIFSHLSHLYEDGASLYVTYLYPRQPGPVETLELWSAAKLAASEAIMANGGTISHQHGVGLDHSAFLEVEKGTLGMDAMHQLARAFDPDQILNPGKLLGIPVGHRH